MSSSVIRIGIISHHFLGRTLFPSKASSPLDETEDTAFGSVTPYVIEEAEPAVFSKPAPVRQTKAAAKAAVKAEADKNYGECTFVPICSTVDEPLQCDWRSNRLHLVSIKIILSTDNIRFSCNHS